MPSLLGEYHDIVTLLTAIAVVGALIAVGALFRLRSLPTSPVPASTGTPPAPAPTDTKPSDANSDDDSDADNSKDTTSKAPLINDAYKLIHQRYNRQTYLWDDFDPDKDREGHDGVIFIVYHRHHNPSAVRPLERVVEVHSEVLKDLLCASLKHIDTVFDPKPMVLLSLLAS
jgi:hypothetical protein